MEEFKKEKPAKKVKAEVKSNFKLGKKNDINSRRDSIDKRLNQVTAEAEQGWLLLETGVLRRRNEFGLLNLVDAKLINSEARMNEILVRVSTEEAKRRNAKVYFTLQADADAFKEIYKSYGFTDDQFGGVLPSLKK